MYYFVLIDSRELSAMRVIKVIKVVKRVRGRPKQLVKSSSGKVHKSYSDCVLRHI